VAFVHHIGIADASLPPEIVGHPHEADSVVALLLASPHRSITRAGTSTRIAFALPAGHVFADALGIALMVRRRGKADGVHDNA
jgi:hypothetical protein